MYSFEVDVWTLGCILAELALNAPLFDGDTEIEQLLKIYAILGVDESQSESVLNNLLPKWKPIRISDICSSRTSHEFISLCNSMIPTRKAAFQKLLKLGAALGAEGMNLLESLLQTDPHKRPSPSLILSHPFFREWSGAEERRGDLLQLECMWQMLLNNERKYRPKSNYMEHQPSIDDTMRSILVDWLIDVSVHFELTQETLHLAVTYLDRTLSELAIDRSKLQLLGVACLKVSDVFNERSKEYYRQENAKEYAYITAGEYSESELLALEKEVLMLLKFQLYSPSVPHFLKLYYALMNIEEKTRVVSDV
eukprot:TRINITY_DN13082_c0_g5_i1.p1 TRINITY_DN13082_c0_g5~~TRINITY_DN13082_c0_g5_i1.p1  ORF type:complete len:309 (+),score=78.07 TRINITY_DN13082_c0_g5_i1:480-1406(+)